MNFTHNLQSNFNTSYYITSTLGNLNWKLEGHAEYISREFKNDGKLKSKIDKYILEESKDHVGIPVFDLEDGTKQGLSYFKCGLVIQYLMEEKGMDYNAICASEMSLEALVSEMIEWRRN